MKTLFMLISVVVLLSNNAWALDCRQITAKYIKAAQAKDYDTLVSMSAIYQHNSKAIIRDYPKYKVESALAQLYESEKRNVVTWMFPPLAKWNVLEVKDEKIQLQQGKSANGCLAYVQLNYADNDNAPDEYSGAIAGKRLKSTVAALAFNLSTGTIYRSPMLDRDMSHYWDTLSTAQKKELATKEAEIRAYEAKKAAAELEGANRKAKQEAEEKADEEAAIERQNKKNEYWQELKKAQIADKEQWDARIQRERLERERVAAERDKEIDRQDSENEINRTAQELIRSLPKPW